MVEKKKRKGAWKTIWITLGLIVLFSCGIGVGLIYNNTLVKPARTCIPDAECSDLAK